MVDCVVVDCILIASSGLCFSIVVNSRVKGSKSIFGGCNGETNLPW